VVTNYPGAFCSGGLVGILWPVGGSSLIATYSRYARGFFIRHCVGVEKDVHCHSAMRRNRKDGICSSRYLLRFKRSRRLLRRCVCTLPLLYACLPYLNATRRCRVRLRAHCRAPRRFTLQVIPRVHATARTAAHDYAYWSFRPLPRGSISLLLMLAYLLLSFTASSPPPLKRGSCGPFL